jgi:hypothetical protein
MHGLGEANNKIMDNLLNTILPYLGEGLLNLLIFGALFAFLYGLIALLFPNQIIALNRTMGCWVSMRRSLKPLEVPRQQEQRLYHHHRTLGLLLLFSSLFILYQLRINHELPELRNQLATGSPYPLVTEIVVTSAYTFLLWGALISMVIGAIIAFRPSLLKGFEKWSNRWISTRQALKFLDQSYRGPDNFFNRNPQLSGGIIITGALYTLLTFLFLL